MDRALLTGAGSIVILICFAGAFVGLTSNSLWLDEMFTAFMTDPTQSSLKAVVLRLSEAVHPPRYYSLLWTVLQVWQGDFIVVSRTLSAVLGCLAVLALIVVPARDLPLPPRLLAAAFAAGSQLWFYMTQEARSYTLVFLLVTCLLGLALRCLPHLSENRIPWSLLVPMALLATAASLTHYFAFLVSGATFFMLLLSCRTWPVCFAVAGTGLAVAAVVGTYVIWHFSRIVAVGENNWYETSLEFLLGQVIYGLPYLLQSGTNKLFIATVLALLVLAAALQGPRAFWQGLHLNRTLGALGFLLGVFVLTLLLALIVTFAVVPMFSWRIFLVLAPVFWISLAYVLGAVLEGLDGSRLTLAVAVVLALVTLPLAKKTLNRGQDAKQAWRHSAERIAALPGCASGTLPVLWFDWDFSTDSIDGFYGYYLHPDPGREWLKISRNDPLPELAAEEMANIVSATLSGARDCPVLLWSVHFLILVDQPERIQQALEAHLPEGSDRKIRLEVIKPEQGWESDFAHLYILE